MTKEKIKPTVDEMIFKVLEYMHNALDDDTEFYELTIECAATFMASDIDIDDNMENIMDYLIDKNHELFDVMGGGILAAKEGKKGV